MRATSLLSLSLLALLCSCGGDVEPTQRGILKYGVPNRELRPIGGGAPAPIVVAAAPVPGAAAGGPVVMKADPEPAGGSGGAPKGKPGKYKVIEVKDGGRIRGVCKLSKAYEAAPVEIGKDVEKCGHGTSMASERVICDKVTLALANCVVYLSDIAAGKDWEGDMAAEERTFVLDQKGCTYIPHVGFLRTETQLVVKNSDPAEHNIHGYRGSEVSTQFNFGTAPKATLSEVAEAFLEDPAKYIVKCDIHPWMSAYLHAVRHPYYAVTDAKGEYVLENVPPGTYQVVCWHEGMTAVPVVKDGAIAGYNYGKDVEVGPTPATVTAGGETAVDFQVPAP